ncbi:MAG: response regulator transcription factor [Trichlorobacter sp.]|uniref:response regulator transcription factor n=1 Tax=Trichlorobacter sp. TaxID=2911007 RepID=UPI00256E3530|nr:response regulator transcription factor [Trichlorobacter sp.]MDK9718103.1 response regulator transcription factor [Trichlorobacter sp.]
MPIKELVVADGKLILLVDDDPNILQVAGFALQKSGFQIMTAQDGNEALARFRADKPDLVLLDVMMPERDGTDLCRIIRKESETPVIFLSSMSDEIDKVVGLELGADDYITKPFSPRELVARIKTVLRRSAAQSKPETPIMSDVLCQYGYLKLDSERFQVFWESREIALTATEFCLLRILLSVPGKVFNRSELVERAYGGETFVSDRTVDSHIRHIRDKFRPFDADPIETLHGIGYKLSDCGQGTAR